MLTAKPPTQETVDVVAALGGAWHGYNAMCCCPAHADTTPSLSIRQGDRGILVTCFAGCDREAVLREIGRLDLTRAPMPVLRAGQGTANVQRLWDEALDVRGTLAERYLFRRNLPPDLPDIRFHPRCPFRPKPLTKFLPALLVAVRQGRELTAIQRILLDPATEWHRGKYMLGQPARGAWRSPFTGTELGLAESFEDAAAFTRLHGIPCWSALGARRLPLVKLPDVLTRLLLTEDRDAEGRRAADKAIAAYQRPGLVIERHAPPRPHKDWSAVNEEARATAA
jgi:hypothetical protein